MKRFQMKLNIAIEGMVLFIFGLIFIPESWNSIIHAKPTSYGQGYLPFCTGISLSICGVIILWEAFQAREEKRFEGTPWRKIFKGLGITLISMIAYSGLISLLGFSVSTFLLLVILLQIFKAYSWPMTLVISVCMAISFHYIFRVWLFLPLPLGLLF